MLILGAGEFFDGQFTRHQPLNLHPAERDGFGPIQNNPRRSGHGLRFSVWIDRRVIPRGPAIIFAIDQFSSSFFAHAGGDFCLRREIGQALRKREGAAENACEIFIRKIRRVRKTDGAQAHTSRKNPAAIVIFIGLFRADLVLGCQALRRFPECFIL